MHLNRLHQNESSFDTDKQYKAILLFIKTSKLMLIVSEKRKMQWNKRRVISQKSQKLLSSRAHCQPHTKGYLAHYWIDSCRVWCTMCRFCDFWWSAFWDFTAFSLFWQKQPFFSISRKWNEIWKWLYVWRSGHRINITQPIFDDLWIVLSRRIGDILELQCTEYPPIRFLGGHLLCIYRYYRTYQFQFR